MSRYSSYFLTTTVVYLITNLLVPVHTTAIIFSKRWPKSYILSAELHEDIRWRSCRLHLSLIFSNFPLFCSEMNYRVSAIETLNGESAVVLEYNFDCLSLWKHQTFNCFPPGIYLLKVNNENSRKIYEICSKLTIKTKRRQFNTNLFSST